VLTGIFAQSSVAGFDGLTTIPGGWLDGHWVQLGWQLADSCAGFSYSLVVTTIILWVMHFIDDYEMGEFAYDYVGLEQDLGVKDVEGGLERERVNATSGGREPRHDGDSNGDASVAEKRAT
jgi:Amt family ammonium transporter